MREPISLKEILAIIVRKGRTIVYIALSVAILAGCYQLKVQIDEYRKPENTDAHLESVYQTAKASYDEQIAVLNKSLDTARKKLEQQQAYNDNSILMRLDPYQVAMDTTILSISNVDEILQEGYALKGVSPNYFVNKIQDFYELYWNSLALTEVLKNHAYTDSAEQYLQELVTVNVTESGTFTITVKAETTEIAAQLGDAAYRCLQSMHNTIEENTYSHTLSVINRTTKVYVDNQIEENQKENQESILSTKAEITNLETQINNLAVPQKGTPYSKRTVVVNTVKWGCIGAAVGIALACVWVLILFLMRNRAESSRQMEQILGVSYLGSTAKNGSIWNRLAQKLLGERTWSDPQQAAGFIAESLKAAMDPTEQLAVITTLNTKYADAALAPVAEAAATVCGKIHCVKNAEKNPETVALFGSCKYAVLAERVSVSEMPEVIAAIEMAKKQGVQIVGFVTI